MVSSAGLPDGVATSVTPEDRLGWVSYCVFVVAYMVAHVRIHDPGWLESEYMSVAATLEAKYGGVHVASGRHDQVEGVELGPVTSILQFPTLAAAEAFWNDPEYRARRPASSTWLRQPSRHHRGCRGACAVRYQPRSEPS